MVTRLNEKELRFLISTNRPKGIENLLLNLQTSMINKWIEDGIFAFIKKELQQYHNLKFGCLKYKTGCRYFFIVENNNEALIRFEKFFDKLLDGEKVPLYKFSTNSELLKWKIQRFLRPNKGTYNECPLF